MRALARELGVPEAVISRPPSAGLWEGQTDEGEIGLAYVDLDAALGAIAAGDTDRLDPNTRNRALGLMTASEHKRRPVPIFRREELNASS